ncbi:MAG: nucleoside-diphosphate kinase [Candidatus Hydrothermales bacterium]
MEKTLLVIKPDAVERNLIGKILSMCEENGFKILDIKFEKMTREKAESFYRVHKDKPFFKNLIDYMTEKKVVAVILEGERAIERLRDLVGATNPKEARPGTIRYILGIDVTRNSVHASDSKESFEFEVKHFF